MRLATRDQAQQIDLMAREAYGLTSEILMEAAGAGAAREISQSFFPELTRGQVIAIVGPGHNGGDALVAARHLHSSGFRDLTILLAAPEELRSELFAKQLDRAERQGLRLVDLLNEPQRLSQVHSAKLIIDGLFGIGLNRQIEAPYVSIIEAINASSATVVSLDCPSGLNVSTGRVEGISVQAQMTITFGLAKPGFFVSEGPKAVGRLRILPIGFPFEALRGIATSHFLFTEKLAKRYLPKRLDSANKSNHGHILIAAGQSGTWGAGVLASSSAFRMGAGYVTWASWQEPVEALRQIPEVMMMSLDNPELFKKTKTAVVVGPGLGVSKKTAEFIESLKSMAIPVVVDADAITACVEHKLFPLPAHWVITPHAGELSRILKIHTQDIERDRFRAAFSAFEATGCHVLLKGYRSILAFEKRCMIVNAGNSALAKAGTGDVLSGMIGGLLAQGLDTTQATATAAFLHGRLADDWVRAGQDKAAMTASDLGALLPQAVALLRRSGSLDWMA